MQENEPQALEEYKQLLQQYKTANFPETNLRLHTLLRCLGLSKYEIQAYIALVEEAGQELNVTQIVKNSGIPHPRAYDTLKNLVKYGMITVKTYVEKSREKKIKRKPMTYKAFEPAIGLENLFAFFTFAKEEAKTEIRKLTNFQMKTESGIWEIIGRDNIINTIKILVEAAQNEILLTADLPLLQKIRHSLISVSKRNVVISCVLNVEDVTDLQFVLEDMPFLRLKSRRHYPMPYIILDRAHAIQWNFDTFDQRRQSDPEFIRAQVIDQVEMIDTLIDHFFFLNWRLGKKTDPIQKIDLPITFIHSATAVEEIEKLMNDGIKPKVTVKGYRTNTGEAIYLRGTIVSWKGDWESGVFAINMKTDNDEEVSAGGFGAIYEDVAASEITLFV